MTSDRGVRMLAVSLLASTGCVLPSGLGTLDTGGESSAANTFGSEGHSGPSDSTGDGVVDQGPPPVGPAKIDFLFVLDNSGSMGEEQAGLADTIESFVTALEQVDNISYRIGVTTTDNGNPWCGSTAPEAGKLQLSSCRGRQGQFVFNGSPAADVTQVACLDVCAIDEISVAPTPTADDPTPRPRPWIEGGAGGSNLVGVSVAEALRCTLPQGIAGCGFESPLMSAEKAILRSQHESEPQSGFMRADAHLAVIFVTDETDCSYNDDYEAIFLPESMGGNPEVFWTDPTTSAPSSAVCWNAGVQCTGGPGTFEECHPVNRDVEGAYGVPDDRAVMHPPNRFISFFGDILAQKRAIAGASVFMFGLVGVPHGYPTNPIVYREGEGEQGLNFGIAPGCSSAWGEAIPPVREKAVIEAFRYEGMAPNLYSICQPPLAEFYSDVIAQLAPFLG